MINDDTIVRRDASPESLFPDIVDERKCEEYNKKPRPACCWITFVVSVILCVFLGAGISLCFRGKSVSSTSAPAVAPDNVFLNVGGDKNCVVDDVFFQCTRQKTGLMTHVPECIVDVYNVYKEYWITTVDPLFPLEPDFCSPENIALMVVASYANDPKHVEVVDLKTIYILAVFFFALDGYDWFSSNFWISYAPVSKWHGIEVNDQGEVVSISLPGNHISGKLPRQLANLESLEFVDLSNNFIEGPLFEEIGNLKELQLNHNALTGTVPSSWTTSTQLQSIQLGFNELTGTLPPGLGKMDQLQQLSLPTNYINATIPTEIGECASLQVLDLRHNRLEGYLPDQISELSRLRYLDLSGNSFEEAPLPAKIFNLNKLQRLHLSGCKLTGTVPPSVGNIVNLTILELGMNQLGGRLPSQLGKLSGLTHLDFELNKLTGTVPSQLGELSDLVLMDLSRNRLTGSLPSSFGQLMQVRSILFVGNELDGTIPDEVCHLWDTGDLQELGLISRSATASCGRDSFGGTACPNAQCCRNCPKLAPSK